MTSPITAAGAEQSPVAPGPPAMPGHQGQPGVPAVPALRWRRTFGGHRAELRQLRCWLAELLPRTAPASSDVVAVAVELATNAVRHTASGQGGRFTVEIARLACPPALRVEVHDDGAPQGPRWPDNPDPMAGRGLGLYLVKALACRAGSSGSHRGRRVWADVPWPGQAGTAGTGARRR